MAEFSANAAVQLRRCTELEYILLGDLRDLLEEGTSSETRRWMVAVLDVLLDMLPREFALKSRDGYLSEVVDAYPNWSPEVQRLQSEQSELYVRLHEFRDELNGRRDSRQQVRRLQKELELWMEAFVAHHRQETDLLQKAMNTEVGCGD